VEQGAPATELLQLICELEIKRIIQSLQKRLVMAKELRENTEILFLIKYKGYLTRSGHEIPEKIKKCLTRRA